jgi:hypothetical protein
MSNIQRFSSRKEVTEFLSTKGIDTSNWSEEKWLSINKGQAEIHIMQLAESIWDAVNESTAKQLGAGEWHLPMLPEEAIDSQLDKKLKWCVGIHANTSYTVIADGNRIKFEQAANIHNKCIEKIHSSVFEHCARAMSDEEYNDFIKGQNELYKIDPDNYVISYNHKNSDIFGWCYNLKGFISYRYLIDNKINL